MNKHCLECLPSSDRGDWLEMVLATRPTTAGIHGNVADDCAYHHAHVPGDVII